MSKQPTEELSLSWVKESTNYDKISNDDLQEENKKIINILKQMETKLDKELHIQQKTISFNNHPETTVNQEKVHNEHIKNN